jgi:Arylsulfotransferase (ASST)
MARLLRTIRANWPLLYFGLSVIMIVFAAGVAVAKWQIFPYPMIEAAWDAARDWRDNWTTYLRVRPDKMIETARHDGDGVVLHSHGKASPGVTFVTGLFGESQGMELVDLDGRQLHTWRVSFNEVWPTAAHLEEQPHDWDVAVHGALLYPNGDVVFNFSHYGMVKIDRCSDVVWKLPYRTHHSVYRDTEGNLWAPGWEQVREASGRTPKIPAPHWEDFVVKVSQDGQILDKFSILDVIYRSHQEGILFPNGRGSVRHSQTDPDDNITHMNDVEIFETDAPRNGHLFQHGDIMVSMRNLNLIVVIDPETKAIKWSRTGPYLRQHDPDFLPDAAISVFDNRMDNAGGAVFGGSRILEVDPAAYQVDVVYEGEAGDAFYTDIMGKHQRLPNGNVLITESLAGRAFEVAEGGEVVWQYVNRWDEDEVAWISQATRYPADYAAFAEETCQ